MIIGEAVNRLRRVDPVTADRISETPQIIGLRNAVVHGYSRINYLTVWQTIRESVPVLRAEVAELLAQPDER